MREILFRGKRVDNGEWVYGDLIKDYLSGQYFIHPYGDSANESDKVGEEGCLRFFSFEVIPETICEYTGLTDKNGNKIFEGDIIKVVTEDTHEERFIEVGIGEFTDDGSGDLFIGAYLKYDGFTVSAGQIKECGSNGVEIIGNIYDNPELLEK